jgi:CRP/FNR family cyclic AMP-dependent transcriptional regulator
MKERIEALRSIPLFGGLEEDALNDIADLLIDRRYPRGSVIFEEGVPGDYMYLIKDGQVKISKLSDDGREKILEILGAGDFVGEMALLDRGPRSASVKSTQPCVLLALSRQDFLSLLRERPEISLELIRELSRRLRETNEQIRGLLFERVEGRTRRLLRRLASEPLEGRPDRLATSPTTHQQLADQVGTSRETITRVLKELRADGWLEQEGKRYLVPVED